MKWILRFAIFFVCGWVSGEGAYGQKLITRFEKSGGKESPTYYEITAWWKQLAASSQMVQLKEMGMTDAGFPLQLVLLSSGRDFDISRLKQKGKAIILFNNGIHPGEPDGIDASMLLARDIVEYKYVLPSDVVVAIIPVYNIGGCLNRSTNYRIDQDGPVEKGFRGNAENLDLNRDFIKCDSKNAFAFTQIFHYLDPDVFADNHVSDGADYQHVMTLLTSQHNKLGGEMGDYLDQQFEPGLYALMKTKGYDLVPYVNHSGETPDKGWAAYWDSPRYSSGYTTLWSTFSFTPETHMLKPYGQRVASTLALMESMIEFTATHKDRILQLRSSTRAKQAVANRFPIAWKLDKTQHKDITFKGYEAGHKASEVSGLPRLYYDRSKPFTEQVPFYNTYVDTLSVEKPAAYIIPQGWWKVIERLRANEVKMRRFSRDTAINVEWYRIESFQSSARPYEGHHGNRNVQLSVHNKTMRFRRGDYYIPMNQAANRFVTETLEPQGEDSYFAWNFFDPILGQKEGYSDYHFEDIAAAYLKDHPELKQRLEEKRKHDPAFARNADAQLEFVFENSAYFEPAYLEYPVYRLMR